MEWLTLLAIVLGPILAVQASEWIQRIKEKSERRLRVFKILMSTRATKMSPLHIEALNLIDVEFHGNNRNTREVIEAWKIYHDHLSNRELEPSIWNSKGEDLFVELLHKMSKCVGYDFEKSQIKKTSYIPEGYTTSEQEQHLIRSGLSKILQGRAYFPVRVSEFPVVDYPSLTEDKVKTEEL